MQFKQRFYRHRCGQPGNLSLTLDFVTVDPSNAFVPDGSAAEPLIAVEPSCWRTNALARAVVAGGGRVVPAAEATALVWADQSQADQLPSYLHDGIDWVQLPFAGVEPFVDMFDTGRRWTCGKGVYAPPVAEAALAMLLAGFRNLVSYSQARTWTGPVGQNLCGSHVVILGGGGITESLLALLAPFGCTTTVLRKSTGDVAGATATRPIDDLHEVLPDADAVVLALALTPETVGIIGAAEFALMKPTSWIVNVARGGHIDTDALVSCLDRSGIGGAALDVTDPEPLPDGHTLWGRGNALITPHVGNTPEMGLVLLAERVRLNVERYRSGQDLLGPVDVARGY